MLYLNTMINTVNFIATIISIVFSIISIFFAVKSKKYKEEAVQASQSYEFVKFVSDFETSSGDFIQKTSLSNWNKGKRSQPCINRLLEVLHCAPKYYIFLKNKDEKQISEDAILLESYLCNIDGADNEYLEKIRDKINCINGVLQKESAIKQTKVAVR